MYKKSKTIVETVILEVPGFDTLCGKLRKSFTINGKAESYTWCLAHFGIHYSGNGCGTGSKKF